MRKFLSKGFVKGFLVLFGVCVSLLLIIQAPPLKRKALEWVIESALNEPNHQVKIEGIGGFFPFSLHASKCIMNDKNGTWMELKGIDASLKVFPSRGYFSLDSLNLYRPPILEFPSKISLMDVFSALIGQTSIRSFVIKQIQIDSSIWGKTYEANLLLTPDNQDGQKISLKSSVEGVAQKTIKVEVVINRALSKKEKISIEQLEFSQEEKFIVKGKALLDIALPLVKAETDLSVTLLSNKDVNNSFNFVTNLIYDVKKKNLTLKGEADKFSILGAWGEEFFGKKLQWSIHADLQNTNDIIVESLNLSSDKGHFLQGEARFSTIQLQGKFTTSLASHDVLKENKSPIIFETVLSGNLTKPVLKTHVNLPEVVPFHIKDAEIMADFGHTDFWTFHLQALGQGAKIDIKVDHHPDLKKTGIQVNADADNFEPWFKGIVPVHLEANLDENLTGTITGLVKGIKLGSLSLMQTDLSMVLKEGRGEFDLKSIQRVSRKKKTAVPILVSRGEVNFKNSALLIKEIKLTPGTHIISLDRPCLIDFKNVSVDQLELSIAQGKIKVEKFNCASCTENQTHQVWSGQISINNVPLSILQIFESSLAMSGEINGHAQLFGEQFFPEIKGQLKVSDVTYEPFAEKQSQSLKKVNGEIDFNWLSNSLDWKIRGHAEPALTFTSDGKITLLNGRIQSSSQVQMQLKGSLHLGVFSAFLGGGDRIDGILTTDLTVAGNVEKPFLKGSVQLDNGLYEIADFGTMIHNITLRAEAKDSRVVISSLTATDGLVKEHKPGQLNGQGHVDLKQLFSPFVDIRLDLTNFQVAQSDSFMGKATGPLFLKGEGLKSKVTGEVLLEPAELFLEEAASSDIPTINMVNQRTELKKQDKKTGPQENDSKLLPIELKLNAPKSFKIEGFGLESTWGGTMMVVGTVGDPQLVGMIKIEKGKLDVFGKAMKIKEGSITYKEEPKDDPYLLIYCVRDVDAGTTVTLVIEGFASNPRFTLLSTPALPEEEILSRLLFGKELGKISVGQSLQLATAVAAMNGKKGLNVMDQIRSSFGLDTLELKEQKKADSYDTTGSQAVSIGKEFGNVKISIDQGVSTGTSKATLEAAVSPNLNVDVDVGGDQSSGVGLTWVKRY